MSGQWKLDHIRFTRISHVRWFLIYYLLLQRTSSTPLVRFSAAFLQRFYNPRRKEEKLLSLLKAFRFRSRDAENRG